MGRLPLLRFRLHVSPRGTQASLLVTAALDTMAQLNETAGRCWQVVRRRWPRGERATVQRGEAAVRIPWELLAVATQRARVDARRWRASAETRRGVVAWLILVALAGACGEDDVTDAGPADTGLDDPVGDLGGDVEPDAGDTGPLDTGRADLGVDTGELDAGDTGELDAAEEVDLGPTDIDNAQPILFEPELHHEAPDSFPVGVQAGAVRADSALLWTFTRLTQPMTLRVWRDSPRPREVLLVDEQVIEPPDPGYVHARVEELAPGTWYQYAFFQGTEASGGLYRRSLIGRFRTALPEGALEPVRVAGTSCLNQRYAPWEALARMAEAGVDVFLHAGDIVYADPADTLEEYRDAWLETLADPGYRALFASTGAYLTWDDHEVANNYDPETIDPAQFEAARQAFLETVAVETDEEGRIWTSYMWGDSVEFIILDCRSERLPSTRSGPDATYISQAQMDFLKDRLLNSSAHFRVVLNSVAITNMPLAWDLGDEDRWEGYPAQRDELLQFIYDNELRNVWFLTGDFHIGFVAHVEPGGPGNALYEIAMGPGGNGPNPLGVGLSLLNQFEFHTLETEVATYLTFDPVEDTVRVVFTDDEGDVLYDEVLSQ